MHFCPDEFDGRNKIWVIFFMKKYLRLCPYIVGPYVHICGPYVHIFGPNVHLLLAAGGLNSLLAVTALYACLVH